MGTTFSRPTPAAPVPVAPLTEVEVLQPSRKRKADPTYQPAKRVRFQTSTKSSNRQAAQSHNRSMSGSSVLASAKPKNVRQPDQGKDREEDIRGTITEDAPVKQEYLLRAVRGENGSLALDTQGKPLYAPDFFTRYAEKELVVATNGAQGPDSVPVARCARLGGQPGQQSNQLTYQLRKLLRKRNVEFERTHEKSSLWNNALFDSGQLTGAFGVPEKRSIDLRDKLYLAPLTTVGNLPFRRVCKRLGADITCGEMAMARNVLQGHNSEWALLRRHSEEDVFGVQLAGSNVDVIARAAELIGRECAVDFIELNAGCPIDLVFKRGGGCSLMSRRIKLAHLVWTVGHAVNVPVGVKMRTGIDVTSPNAHQLIPDIAKAGAQWVTIHGRSRKQRYSKLADWNYIRNECAPVAQKARIPLLGNGDVYNWRDAVRYFECGDQSHAGITSVMIARGALIKPWLFTEIKERRDWDIRSGERLELYKQFAKFGLDHWGADSRGVENTRRFLLEWLSFLYRYIPVGIVEGGSDTVVTMSHRAPFFRGRDDLETLLASPRSVDWVRITEMLLGKAPDGFTFEPRHKSNAWISADDNG